MRSKNTTPISPIPQDPYLWTVERIRRFLKPCEFWWAELSSPARLPWARTVRGWRRGFGRSANLVYQLDRNDPTLYVSEYQQNVRSVAINGHFDHVVNNKLLLPLLMRSVGLRSPRLFGVRRGRLWFDADGSIIAQPCDWLVELISRQPELVFKPIKGLKGRGVVFIKGGEDGPTLNGRVVSEPALADLVSSRGDAIVTEFVRQAHYASRLYPGVSNSIRLLTLWDYVKGRPFIAAAAQRIGSERSFPVDNWRVGLGGFSAEVNLETGALSAGVTVRQRKLVWFSSHPETQAEIEGTLITGWDRVKTSICAAAAKLFFARIIGWDVLVTETDFVVLEINSPPGLAVHQVHRPLLGDKRVRRFFERHGVIAR